jgi:Ca-activated chloride channel family protein
MNERRNDPMPTPTPLPLLPFKADASRGFGILEAAGNASKQLPLARVEVRARVVDRFLEATMTEVFRNPFAEHLEATYVFPLPGGAAVSSFEMRVAGRVVLGVVEERGEARRQYQSAIEEGKRAALLEKERDDVFTVAVGNLPPGEEVEIRIRWSERLPYFDDGTTELRLPLVVAPRYIPGSALERPGTGSGTEHDTDVVPDASRITPPRLAEGFDPKTGLSIEVEVLEAELDDVACSQHATRTRLKDGAVTVALAREGERLNRDFILRWRVAGPAIRTRAWTHGGFAAISIVPPRREGFLGTPRDVVFVLDRSGSMEGEKMTSANRACALLLATLGPRDRFAIQLFDDRTDWYDPSTGRLSSTPAMTAADEGGLEKGEKFLRTVEARGGTELDQALSEVLAWNEKRADSGGRAQVVVLLTDGQVGDESRVLKRIQTELGDSRVFTVGIDTAVNEAFLRRLAGAAGGTATFVAPGEGIEEALRAVGREIGAPLVVDVRVESALELAPATVPDLFEGRATVAYLKADAAKPIRVTGRFADGKAFEQTIEATPVEMDAIGQLWARSRIMDLEDRFRLRPHEQGTLREEIVAVSKACKVLSRFTAFVVVDQEIVNKGGDLRQMTQPVEMPDRWEMDAMGPGSFPAAAAPASVALMQATAEAPMPTDMWEGAIAPPPPPASSPPIAMRRAPMPGGGGPPSPRKPTLAGLSLPRSREAEGSKAKEAVDDGAPEVVAALRALEEAIAAALAEIRGGRRPDPNPLEVARKRLIKALAASSYGPDLGLAQRFARTAALELVAAASSPEVETGALLPLFERHAKALEEAREEATRVIGQPFWESSI